MSSEPSVPKTVQVLLSVLAGYVDSCTFLALFGLFVAQVTGSFVLAGVQLVQSERGALVKLLAIPAFFLAGVAATLLVRRIGGRDGPALALALLLETVLLGGLLLAWLVGAPLRDPDAPAAICAALFGLAAMGVQSALVRLEGAPSTNVMTSNTTQLAIDATDLTLAWRARRRAPDDAALTAAHARARARFHALWPVILGFLVGTLVGALAYARFDLWCIVAAIALAGALTAWASRAGSA